MSSTSTSSNAHQSGVRRCTGDALLGGSGKRHLKVMWDVGDGRRHQHSPTGGFLAGDVETVITIGKICLKTSKGPLRKVALNT